MCKIALLTTVMFEGATLPLHATGKNSGRWGRATRAYFSPFVQARRHHSVTPALALLLASAPRFDISWGLLLKNFLNRHTLLLLENVDPIGLRWLCSPAICICIARSVAIRLNRSVCIAVTAILDRGTDRVWLWHLRFATMLSGFIDVLLSNFFLLEVDLNDSGSVPTSLLRINRLHIGKGRTDTLGLNCRLLRAKACTLRTNWHTGLLLNWELWSLNRGLLK